MKVFFLVPMNQVLSNHRVLAGDSVQHSIKCEERATVPLKVMSMGGWKDMKTTMVYIRKAGIDIKGITDRLNLHDPVQTTAHRAGSTP
jgi:hypothetical protein